MLQGRVPVWVRGPVGAHPVLFIGGWGLSGDRYRASLEGLTEVFRVYIVGLPGFGNVPGLPLKQSTVEGMTEVALAAWQELDGWDSPETGARDRYTLMGHSTGGTVAALLAQADPYRVSEVVPVLPAGSPDPIFKAWPRLVEHVRRYPLGSGDAGLSLSLSPALVNAAVLAVSAKNFDVVPTLTSIIGLGVRVHLVLALDDLVTPPGTLLQVPGAVIHHVHGGHGWFNRETVDAADLLMGILAEHVPAPASPGVALPGVWARVRDWARAVFSR